jgi:hypothetical protein
VDAREARRLILAGTAPERLAVRLFLDLSNCQELTRLPSALHVYSLNVSNCVSLMTLPDKLEVRQLIANGCTGLTSLPQRLRCFELQLQGSSIRDLPSDL